MRLFGFKRIAFASLVLAIIGAFVVSYTNKAIAAIPYINTRVSVDSFGNQANAAVYGSSKGVSRDGKYVMMESPATNLVSGDTNGKWDAFLKNTDTGTLDLVSLTSSNTQINSDVNDAALSHDGRFVVFVTSASNVVAGDTNANYDVFIRDTFAGTTELVSVSTSGSAGNNISGTTGISVSSDGRFVAFNSYASNLVSGDLNGKSDIFIRDRMLGTTTRINVNSGGIEANNNSLYPDLSCDGSVITFMSHATNLVPDDINGQSDVFITNRTESNGLTNITISANGTSSNDPFVSCDGGTVVFGSSASNLVGSDTNGEADTFVYDINNSTIERVNTDSAGGEANSSTSTQQLALSGDGRYILFNSNATNLVSNDTNSKQDVFLKNRESGTTERVTMRNPTTQTVNHSYAIAISLDGTKVSFVTSDPGIVTGDTNSVDDTFLADTGVVTDLIPPTVVGQPSSEPDVNNWYNADVLIDWLASDPLPSSGTPTDPADTLASQEGTNIYTSGQSCDPAGNCATGSLELSIDKSIPVINGLLDRSANTQGWYNNDVTASFNCSDSVSGVASCTQPITVSSEGQNQSVSGTATDLADNTVSTTISNINIDKTLPAINYALGIPANINGWHNEDVTVSFNCADGLSGLLLCSLPTVVTTEGANQAVTGTAFDNAENVQTATAILNIDKTNPFISFALNSLPNQYGWHNQDVTVTFTCIDALSGVASCSDTVTLNTEATNQSAIGTAIDRADNTASITASGINLDKTPGTASNANINRPVLSSFLRSATVTANATDGLSGIVTGELYIDSDPGVGNGTPMTFNNSQLSVTLNVGPYTAFSNHTIYIRAMDRAGNWSTTATTTFFWLF